MSESPLPVLRLPRRWELLEQAAKDVDIDPKEFVEKVDDACKHIDSLLGTIRTGGAGQFEILYGLSGSGKTTFVSTLPKFFVGIDVLHFDGSKPLSHLIAEIKSKHTDAAKNRIFLIVRRDNPTPQDIQQAEVLFSELVDFFRTKEGQVLVLWTITDEKASIELANLAWSKGRDSVCSGKTKGRYIFKGLPKEKFPTIADNTTKSLTGDGLEAFGIDKEIRIDLTKDCETVSDYFCRLRKLLMRGGKRLGAFLRNVHVPDFGWSFQVTQ